MGSDLTREELDMASYEFIYEEPTVIARKPDGQMYSR